jgi:hypothetical protein
MIRDPHLVRTMLWAAIMLLVLFALFGLLTR